MINIPALSFKREWIDLLLSGKKRQTTRMPPPAGKPQRVKVGDVCHVYCEQRRRITEKPLRQMTKRGCEAMEERGYPIIPEFYLAQYYAHFLGKIEIIEVYEICPAEMDDAALAGWAKLDGFDSFDLGDMWFVRHYSGRWADQKWAVIQWDGWQERYFEAGAV